MCLSRVRIDPSNERICWVLSGATCQILMGYATDMNETEGVSRHHVAFSTNPASEHN